MRRLLIVLLSTLAAILLIFVSGGYWLLHTTSGGKFAWSTAQENLPGELHARSLSGDLSSGLILTAVQYRNDGLHVLVDSIKLAVDVDLIPVSITIVQLDINKVGLTMLDDRPEDAESSIEDILVAMRLPIELNVAAARLTDLSLTRSDEAPLALVSSLELDASLHDALRINRLQIVSSYAELTASAQVELQQPFAVQIATEARINDDMPELLAGVELVASAKGVPDHLEVDMRSALPEVTVTGTIDWADGLDISARADVAKLDLYGAVPNWPESYPLQGDISASWHGDDIQVSSLQATVTGTDINVVAGGRIDARSGTVDGSLNWRQIKWPLDAVVPAFVSKSGDVNVSGNLSEWLVDGNLALLVKDFPEGELTIKGGGDKDAAELAVLDSNILGGSVSGRIAYSWRDNNQYSGSLRVADVRTDPLFPSWPGVLSGELEIKGVQDDRSINIELADVHGEIREQSLLASGGISIAPNALEFRSLGLTHGESAVVLDGEIYSAAGIDYELDLPELGEYTNAASGSVEGTGTLSLHATQPRLRANLSAAQIEFGGVEIAELHIEDGAADSDEFLNQRIVARDLRMAGVAVDELSVNAIGDTDEHEIQIQAYSEYVVASLSASGTLRNWQDADSFSWQGELQDLQFELPDGLILALESPAAIGLSANSFSLEQTCLAANNNAAACLHADWLRDQSTDAAAELRQIPLSALMVLVDTEVDFTQTLTGQVGWSSVGSGSPDASAAINISAGRITSKFDPAFFSDTGEGVFGFEIANNRLASGKLDIPFPGYGDIDIDFGVDDVGLGVDSNLSGSVLIDLNDISIIAKLIPAIDSDGGHLATNLVLSGTLAEPSINGDLKLHDGVLYYRPLGTKLTDIQVNASIFDTSQVNLEASFRAGDGLGRIRTSTARQAWNETEFEISGNELLLVDVPDLRVLADPDFRFSIRDRALNIAGRVTIPEARISPETALEYRVSESADVVVIAGEIPGANKPEDEGGMSVNGTLQVVLGDDVLLLLDVATAHFGGSVEFVWQDDIVPIANGVYTVNGTIGAFGQLLTVADGTIRFPGVPANNPHLRIAAEREIYGNTQVRTAGILLTGRAKKPIMEPFTYPLTTEERALTLLATGSDFDYEQGVGAVDFGTYIAPRFYVSYGIGLFERDNVVSARYELKRGFGIKASSGKRDSGVDFNYRLDR